MKTSYFNTTHSTRDQLGQYEEKAKSQEEKILDHFKFAESDEPGSKARTSPSRLQLLVFNDSIPLTSVRRAVTNLTNAGELMKTDYQVEGPYGRPEYQWRLAPKHAQQDLFG